jgi:hypothetical protein
MRKDDTNSIIRKGLKAKDVPAETGNTGYVPKYVEKGKRKTQLQNLKDFHNRTLFHRFIEGRKTSVDLQDLYLSSNPSPAFLVLGGPSLNTLDLESAANCGITSLGVNNSWSVYTPDFWTCVDPPRKFLYSGWSDPTITKLIPTQLANKALRTKENGFFEDLSVTPKSCPNTFFYERNTDFDHQTFLNESTINWGNQTSRIDSLGFKSCRSVMLAGIKLLYVLGFRRIYLLGCDFKMNYFDKNYAFPQERSKRAVKGNNKSYRILNERFKAMKPYFEYNGFEVFNCNPDSGLEAFDYISLEDAIDMEEIRMVQGETAEGWYEGESK